MYSYFLEFTLNTYNISAEALKNALVEFGEEINITECDDPAVQGTSYKISLSAEEPTVVFDTCSQFGRIKSVKVEERRK